MAARDVAVVVDLDPTRLLVEAEQLGDTLEQAALGGVLRHPPVERRAGVLGRVVDQLALGAAHRPRHSTRRLARTANAAANSAA